MRTVIDEPLSVGALQGAGADIRNRDFLADAANIPSWYISIANARNIATAIRLRNVESSKDKGVRILRPRQKTFISAAACSTLDNQR